MRLQKSLTPLWRLHLRRSNNKRGVAAMSKRSRVQIIPNFFWQNSQAYWSLSVSTDYGRLMKPFLNNITSFSANWADGPNSWGIWSIFVQTINAYFGTVNNFHYSVGFFSTKKLCISDITYNIWIALLMIELWNLNPDIYPITSATLESTLKKAIEWAMAVTSHT